MKAHLEAQSCVCFERQGRCKRLDREVGVDPVQLMPLGLVGGVVKMLLWCAPPVASKLRVWGADAWCARRLGATWAVLGIGAASRRRIFAGLAHLMIHVAVTLVVLNGTVGISVRRWYAR